MRLRRALRSVGFCARVSGRWRHHEYRARAITYSLSVLIKAQRPPDSHSFLSAALTSVARHRPLQDHHFPGITFLPVFDLQPRSSPTGKLKHFHCLCRCNFLLLSFITFLSATFPYLAAFTPTHFPLFMVQQRYKRGLFQVVCLFLANPYHVNDHYVLSGDSSLS